MLSERNRFQLVPLIAAVLGFFLISQSSCFAQPEAVTKERSPIKLTARFHIEKAKRTGYLIVKAAIPNGSHIYSLSQTQPLLPTRLAISKMAELRATGKFNADKQAHVIEKDPIFESRVEKHSGTVQFYVPIEIATNADPARLKPIAVLSCQVCSDEGYCIPIQNQKVSAEFAGYFERQAKQLNPAQTDRR